MHDNTINLLRIAVEKREPLKSVSNAVRLVNGYGDGLDGLVLEQYGRHFAAQVFDSRWLEEKDLLTDFVGGQLGAQYFIIKDRTGELSCESQYSKAQVCIAETSSQTVIRENGLAFSVDLNDALNSGLFLDMRDNRRIVSGSAEGRKVLNCFSYTCSFGVYCRAQRAESVVNVDISKKSLERGRLNYELNSIDPVRNELIRADALQYLERAVKKDNLFDLIILDPPSFSRYEGRSFSVRKDMARLVSLAERVLARQGVLFVSTNLSGIRQSELLDVVKAGAGKRRIKQHRYLAQGLDFPGSGWMQNSCLSAVLAQF